MLKEIGLSCLDRGASGLPQPFGMSFHPHGLNLKSSHFEHGLQGRSSEMGEVSRQFEGEPVVCEPTIGPAIDIRHSNIELSAGSKQPIGCPERFHRLMNVLQRTPHTNYIEAVGP